VLAAMLGEGRDWPLETLNVVGLTNINDAVLQGICLRTSLQGLELGFAGVTQNSLTCLMKLSNLTSLTFIAMPEISDRLLDFRYFPKLKYLDLSATRMSRSLRSLSSLTALESLVLNQYEHLQKTCLLYLPTKLECLIISGAEWAPDGRRDLNFQRFPRLTSLMYSYSPNVSKELLAAIAMCTSLRRLSLVGSQVDYRGLTVFKPQPEGSSARLMSLDVSQCPFFRDPDLRYVVMLTSLEMLQIRATEITEQGIRLLTRLPKLRVLDVRDTPIDITSLTILTRLDGLLWTGFTGNDIVPLSSLISSFQYVSFSSVIYEAFSAPQFVAVPHYI
jgi:hypothetical protein